MGGSPRVPLGGYRLGLKLRADTMRQYGLLPQWCGAVIEHRVICLDAILVSKLLPQGLIMVQGGGGVWRGGCPLPPQ